MTDKLRHIVVATDLSDRSRSAVERGLALHSALNAALTVMHVVDEVFPEPVAVGMRTEAANLVRKQIAGFAEARRAPLPEVRIEVPRGRPHAVIAEYCRETDADLLIVGGHRSDPIWDLLHGTTVHRTITLSDTPALVAREGGSDAPRRVLAAVDFSIASERALRLAATLDPEATFSFVHALDLIESAFIPAGAAARYRKQAQAMAEAELDAFVGRLGLAVRSDAKIVRPGNAAEVILDEARRLDAGLVAMGTHGRTGIGHALLGSVALAVIERAKGDVLMVRAW